MKLFLQNIDKSKRYCLFKKSSKKIRITNKVEVPICPGNGLGIKPFIDD